MAYPYYSYGVFDFNSIIQQWSSIGLFDIMLPIILIFTLVFAVLERTKLLGGKKEIDAIVALTIGFFAISNVEVTRFFIPLFSNAALGIAILLVFMLIVGLINPRINTVWPTITLFGGIAIFFWVMSRAASYFGGFGIIFSNEWWMNNAWWLIPLALLITLIALAMKSEERPKITSVDDYSKYMVAKAKELKDSLTMAEWHSSPD